MIRDGRWYRCKRADAYTSFHLCQICKARGYKVVKTVFDMRDGRIPNTGVRPHEVAPRKSRGLGDTVAKTIHRVTFGRVKPCKGCKERQRKLNKLLPYKHKEAV